ncbi:hypothetical protein [Alkalibacillus silvisoli]|uniref:Uncharacterized protein n=1 Tax=Alkalibacillus silvisoli TaxID=392823 RepID=A0ABP3JD59_9BACI
MRKALLILTLMIAYTTYHFTFHYFDLHSYEENPNNGEANDLEIHEETTTKFVEEDYLEASYTEDVVNLNETNLMKQYETQFEDLEQSILHDIEDLRDEVLEEVDSEQNILTQGMNFLKYERQATEIEEQADERFNQLKADMEAAAFDHLIPEQAVDDIIDQYETRKSEIKNSIFDEVNEWLSKNEEI